MATQPLIARLGLGVAQFGLDGAPPRGRPPRLEVRDMLVLAGRAGLGFLDGGSASAHAETVLGEVMPRPSPFALALRCARCDRGADFVEAEARASLGRLGLTRADAIVVQCAADLLTNAGALAWKRLLALRDQGLFRRVGVSAYASDDPVGLARRFRPDFVQAPASLLDQRLLLDGSLMAVKALGVGVHLRSIFLHGLLFQPPGHAPSEARQAMLRLSRARRMIAEGRSDPLQAALAFALSRPEADRVIVGAATAAELAAVLAAAASPPPDLAWDDLALDDPDVLDPRRWPQPPVRNSAPVKMDSSRTPFAASASAPPS